MAQKFKSGRESDKIFALDWRGLAQRGVLGDVLRLFSYRCAWLKEGDQKAYGELERARRAADPNIREAAELLFSEITLAKQSKAPLEETPKSAPQTRSHGGPRLIALPVTSAQAISARRVKA